MSLITQFSLICETYAKSSFQQYILKNAEFPQYRYIPQYRMFFMQVTRFGRFEMQVILRQQRSLFEPRHRWRLMDRGMVSSVREGEREKQNINVSLKSCNPVWLNLFFLLSITPTLKAKTSSTAHFCQNATTA